jgi:hypothetical protein
LLTTLATQIRCTSVDGYRLPAGVDTNERLRGEIRSAKIVIGVLTPNSISSTYVLFELGARWGAGLPMITLLAGVVPEDMRGPHTVLNALSCETDAQLIQLVEDVGTLLHLPRQSASSYLVQAQTVRKLSAEHKPSSVPQVQDAQPPLSGFNLRMVVTGGPNAQSLGMTSTESFSVLELEYMLSDETVMATQLSTAIGPRAEIPLNLDCLRKVFNTPRPDMAHHDHSGPMKLGVIMSVKGREKRYMLPARIEAAMVNMEGVITSCFTVTAAKSFYE